MRARKTRFKQPQNGAKLNLKPTPRTRGIELGRSKRGEEICKNKNNLVSLGNEASKRVSTFDMP